jgi:hypothetical protein
VDADDVELDDGVKDEDEALTVGEAVVAGDEVAAAVQPAIVTPVVVTAIATISRRTPKICLLDMKVISPGALFASLE